MSEEEIKKQYANGIVNADEVIKSLIDKFKTDKTSVDIQQLQLIAEYLLYEVDKLQKENEELQTELSKIQCDNRQMENDNIKLLAEISDLKECIKSWKCSYDLIEQQSIKLINEYLKNG